MQQRPVRMVCAGILVLQAALLPSHDEQASIILSVKSSGQPFQLFSLTASQREKLMSMASY